MGVSWSTLGLMMPIQVTAGPGSATEDPDAIITRAVKALLEWHDIRPVDLDAAIGLPKSTAYRRFQRGGWEHNEVRALASFFSVSIDQLSEGRVTLAESKLSCDPIRLSREHEDAGEAAFSGSDIDALCHATEPTDYSSHLTAS